MMRTDVKYLVRPIRVGKRPWSLTYHLGKPLITTLKSIEDNFEFTEKIHFFDFVYCICGMLIQLVKHEIYHADIQLRNIIYTGTPDNFLLQMFKLTDYDHVYFF